MYLKHFGLTAFPFDKQIPAEELFVFAALHELAVRLGHLVEMSGIGLRSDVLEEMRLLTNYAMDAHNRLCLLFCGQSELRRRISMAMHECCAT